MIDIFKSIKDANLEILKLTTRSTFKIGHPTRRWFRRDQSKSIEPNFCQQFFWEHKPTRTGAGSNSCKQC